MMVVNQQHIMNGMLWRNYCDIIWWRHWCL
jgi:hypothetical protein